MAKEFYTILTVAGKEKLLRATVSKKLEIKTFAVGDGQGRYYEPNEDQVALVNQRYKANVNAVSLEQNQITVECLVPSEVGGFTIRELGIYDKEDTLLLIAKYPATEKPTSGSGSEKDLHIKVIMELDNAENVAVTADLNTVIATMGNVKNELKKYYNKQEVDEKIEGFTSVEVINNLESTETNAALSAAQGKELKRLIDEVPQVEVVDNMTTNNSQKALSAAQGVVIAEQLKKSGLKIANATYHNNTIAIEDFTLQENVPFLLNLSSVHRDSMQIDRNTKVAFGSRLLKITKFNDIEFLEATEIKQRQFICVKKVDAVWMEVYSAELDNKIFELQQRVSECFQSARDGKVKLADAITSKGQVVDNQASFQEMADKIRGIELGYKHGDKLPIGSVVFKDIKIKSEKNLSITNYPDPISNKKDYFRCGPIGTEFNRYGITEDDDFLYYLSSDSYANKTYRYDNHSSNTEGVYLFLLKIKRIDMTMVASTIIEHFEEAAGTDNSKTQYVRNRMVICRKNYIYVVHSSSDKATYVSKYTKQLTLLMKTKITTLDYRRIFIDEPNGVVSVTCGYPTNCVAFSLETMSQLEMHQSSVERVDHIAYVDGGFLVVSTGTYNLKSYYYRKGKKIWEVKLPTDINSNLMEKIGDYVGFSGGTTYRGEKSHILVFFVNIRDGSVRDANTFFEIDRSLGDISTVSKVILSRHEKRMMVNLGYDTQRNQEKIILLKNKGGHSYVVTGNEVEITTGDVCRGQIRSNWNSEWYFCKNGDLISVTRPQPSEYRQPIDININEKYTFGLYVT